MAGKTTSEYGNQLSIQTLFILQCNYNYNHTYSYNHKWSKSQRKTIAYARTTIHCQNTCWIYETADTLFGVSNSNYVYAGYLGKVG